MAKISSGSWFSAAWRKGVRELSPARRRIRDRDRLVAALDQAGKAEAALELCVENAARHIRQLDRIALPPPAAAGPGPVRRVFVGGFYQSGSSAVLDYLRGYAGVTVWPPAAEMRLIESTGGVADLAARHAKQAELRPPDLVNHYLHITGQKIRSTPLGTYDQFREVNRNSAQLFRTVRAAGYLRTCLAGFLELAELTARQQPSTAALEQQLRRTVGRALDRAARDAGADVILLNQGIRPFRLRYARFAPPSTLVIVHRDPRDQFVDAQAKRERSGRAKQSAAEYAAAYRRKRALAARDLPGIRKVHGHRGEQVGFEDFVHDPGIVQELVGFLGLADRPYGQGRYDAARARMSVGKHQDRIGRSELATLVGALPEFLDHRAGAPPSRAVPSPTRR